MDCDALCLSLEHYPWLCKAQNEEGDTFLHYIVDHLNRLTTTQQFNFVEHHTKLLALLEPCKSIENKWHCTASMGAQAPYLKEITRAEVSKVQKGLELILLNTHTIKLVTGFLSGQYSLPLTHCNQFGKEYDSLSLQLAELINIMLSFDQLLDNPTILQLNQISDIAQKNSVHMNELGLSPIKQLNENQCDELIALIKNLEALRAYVLKPQISDFDCFKIKRPREEEKEVDQPECKKICYDQTNPGFFSSMVIDKQEEPNMGDTLMEPTNNNC
jgi:hypothetical protein